MFCLNSYLDLGCTVLLTIKSLRRNKEREEEEEIKKKKKKKKQKTIRGHSITYSAPKIIIILITKMSFFFNCVQVHSI